MTTILIEAFWKSGAILGIALLANLALRKKSADLRRLILSSAIATLFIAALATALLPRWNTELPIAPEAVQLSTAAQPVVIEVAANTAPLPVPHREMPNPFPILWLAGAAVLLARFLFALRSLRRLRMSSTYMRGINGIPLLQSETIAAPVTWGILHPVILVPGSFDELPQESRDAILAHEIAHIQSHDFALRSLAEIARALLWFQPLIWIARRRLRQEQELACDDRVLESGANAAAYAKLLLNWNTLPDTQPATAPGAMGISNGSCLKQRICAVLDRSTQRTRVSSKALLLAGALVLTAAIPLAAISFSETIPNPLVITLRTPTPPPMESPAPQSQRRIQLAQNQSGRPATAAPTITTPSSELMASALLVITDVVVTDKTAHTIPGLGVNDFVLTQDGVPQAIRFCEFFQLDAASPISSYYAIGYYTTNTGADAPYRRIKVSLKDQSLAANAKLEFRAGFFPSPAAVTATYDGRFHGEFGTPPSVPDNNVAATLPPGVTKPVLIYHTDPEYSNEARKAKYSGSVDLSVLVDETGKVTTVNVLRPLGMGLDEKAMEAVRQWRFNPATQDGKPVAVQVPLLVNFRLL